MNRKTVILSFILIILAIITIIGNKNLQSFRSVCRRPLIPMFKTLTFFSTTMENKHIITDLLVNMGKYTVNDAERMALIAENRELRKILEMKDRIQYKTITAEVIERTLNINGCLVIDKGISSGVDMQMGAMYLDGLIGKLIESGPNTSIVETYLNINYKISITDRKFKNYYICHSNGSGLLYIEGNNECHLEKGDTVFTSGLGRLYPEGIPVGIFRGYDLLERDSVFIVEPIQHLNTDFILIIKQRGNSLEEEELHGKKELGRIGWYSIKSNI